MIRKVCLNIQGHQNLVCITFFRQTLTGKHIEIFQDVFAVCLQEQTRRIQEASISVLTKIKLSVTFPIRVEYWSH